PGAAYCVPNVGAFVAPTHTREAVMFFTLLGAVIVTVAIIAIHKLWERGGRSIKLVLASALIFYSVAGLMFSVLYLPEATRGKLVASGIILLVTGLYWFYSQYTNADTGSRTR